MDVLHAWFDVLQGSMQLEAYATVRNTHLVVKNNYSHSYSRRPSEDRRPLRRRSAGVLLKLLVLKTKYTLLWFSPYVNVMLQHVGGPEASS